MLFLAPAMVTRPKLAPYRFEMLTALWCRYRSHPIVSKEPKELVDWFTFALFGRHATEYEVRAWLEKGQMWLEDEHADGEPSPPPPRQPKQAPDAHIAPVADLSARESSVGFQDSLSLAKP
jgi:hypothetical protein